MPKLSDSIYNVEGKCGTSEGPEIRSKMVPKLWGHLHVGKHNYAKPEDSDNTKADVGYVYEHILRHNTSFVSVSSFETLWFYSSICPYRGGRGEKIP
jgi:hypothetical protein